MSGEFLLFITILFGSLFILMALGLPLTFCLFGIAIIGLLFYLETPKAVVLFYYTIINTDRYWILITVPLFIFMAGMLERSGITEDLYNNMQHWTGSLAGGLAIGTVFISTLLAAMIGLSSASLVSTGVIALPSMLKRGYHKNIAMGSILAGGTLGILIPPSVIMLVYATEAGVSIGKLFLGGIIPGLLLSSLFVIYLGIKCRFQPSLGPPLPPEERSGWKDKLISFRSLLLPALLVVLVLGSFLSGIATPSEAAAVGAAGAILCAAVYRRLTWQNFKETCYMTLRLTSMIMWILIGARCIRALYFISGATELLQAAVIMLPFGSWGILIVMQFMLIFLGCFLDPFGIILITMPVSIPIAELFGFNPLWLGILFIINMEMAYLTPPVGLNIFYLKGIVPEGITMTDIYRSVIPFVLLQVLALILIMLFPQIALWLPNLIIK